MVRIFWTFSHELLQHAGSPDRIEFSAMHAGQFSAKKHDV